MLITYVALTGSRKILPLVTHGYSWLPLVAMVTYGHLSNSGSNSVTSVTGREILPWLPVVTRGQLSNRVTSVTGREILPWLPLVTSGYPWSAQ